MLGLKNTEWNTYYEEFWQFALTLTAQLLTTIVMSYLLLRTLYLFWCRDCCTKDKLRRTLSREAIERMSMTFKLMTVSYLISFAIYTISSLLLQTYIIVFDASIWCWIPEMMIFWFFIARIILQLIYLTRFVFVFLSFL